LHTARAACEATYQTCLADAGGDPALIALCQEQRSACLAAADNAFISCAVGPCVGDPCVQNCGVYYGFERSSCLDARIACLMNGGSEEHCRGLYDSCVAAAGVRFRECILRCVTPIAVAPTTWGRIKTLYRD
jgi:hypothetical protein